ncbi:MAG: YihY/virulence factor BrkB family protein [Candidatus Gastranaerophilales bacterium]|nr:YihY/virulence factor BrkB family protein [Candidatus Gastranaerophilales bacterium]
MLRRAYTFINNFSEEMRAKNINSFAASSTFFIFVSLVPMLVLICTIIPYTPLTEQNLMTAAAEVIPEVMSPLAQSLIAEVYDKSAGILSVAAVATLWTAGKGVMALIQGLNAINGVEEKRNYLVVRIVSSLYTLLMLVAVLVSLFVMVFGNKLVEIALRKVPTLQLLVSAIMQFRFIFGWVLLTLTFSAIYAFLPNKKLRFREQIPGATFAAVVWSTFSWGFSIYVEVFNSYSIYGSLSLIVIVMLWMYFCMYIILVGAFLNQYFQPVNQELMGGGHK